MKNWKINLIFILFAIVGGVAIGQLANLQIRQGDYYDALASGQKGVSAIPAMHRGGIFLLNGVCLAQNKNKTFLYITPAKLDEGFLKKSASNLAGLLGISSEQLLAEIAGHDSIKKEVPSANLTDLQTYLKQQNSTGFRLEEIELRYYPQVEMASQVLGFTNGEFAGQCGIERFYNDFLSGQNHKVFAAASQAGRGADVFLTIDYNIQYMAEKLLKQAKEQWDIDSGQIVVEDPISGKIVALANFPAFNPNEYGQIRDLSIFLESASQKLFEPGSVFKPITMTAGIEERLVEPETTYIDKGFADIGGKKIYNFGQRVWGEQMMIDVLEESINTGVVFVEQKLGSAVLWRYIKNFGFLEKTGIDLPSEAASANEGLKNGYPRDFAVASFGQGIMITPLQILRAFSAFTNNGQIVQPYLVEKIVLPDGQEIAHEPVPVKKVISEATANKIATMLISVVKNGAGRAAKIPGYYIAGKTGTAQVPVKGGYSDTATVQSFVGFFPALKPQYLIIVKLDNPKGVDSSGHSATVYFHDLAKYIIDLKQIPPTPDAP
ncbi:MAG: penicillin-binding protein 2 [Candidatus Gribaldobacteria bacterium]|nr:penicillin-binding protein 2 [Candidatus Gribaldobacteria bacterium]